MDAEYVMNERLGLVTYERPHQVMFLPEGYSPGKTYSEAKAGQIDEEVALPVEETHKRVQGILSSQRKVLEELAALLSKEEMVQGDGLRKMLGKRPEESQSRA